MQAHGRGSLGTVTLLTAAASKRAGPGRWQNSEGDDGLCDKPKKPFSATYDTDIEVITDVYAAARLLPKEYSPLAVKPG